MKCISTMDRITFPSDFVLDIIKMYQYKGKEFYYKNVFTNNYKKINEDTIEKDAFYLAKIFGTNVTDHKLKLIICKNATPKNKEETFVYNLKKSIEFIHKKTSDFLLNPNEIIDMAKFMFKDYKEVQLSQISININQGINQNIFDRKTKNIRNILEEFINYFNEMLKSNNYEFTLLISNFYIDFINLKPFKYYNEEIGLMLIYCIMIKEELNLFRYASFFETYYHKLDIFKRSILQANFNWEEGFSQTQPFHKLLVLTLLEVYEKIEFLLRNYTFDSSINKSYDIENSILKATGIFTKEELRLKHPFVSDSTIDRTLKRLRDENKIKPLSTGRSAKWVKVVEEKEDNPFAKIKQLGLFGE